MGAIALRATGRHPIVVVLARAIAEDAEEEEAEIVIAADAIAIATDATEIAEQIAIGPKTASVEEDLDLATAVRATRMERKWK